MLKIRIGLLTFFLFLTALPAFAQEQQRQVLVLTAEGPLTTAMREYILRGLQIADEDGAEAVVITLNTPGGSITLMNEIITAIRASDTPVVVYVSPSGAIAGSAGTLITLAGHAAAMAPETAIGAASPVDTQGQDLGETMAAKEKNILKAEARTLAERRGPEAVQLAERTIETAEAVSASEALAIGLIDFIAEDITVLLTNLDGFEVRTAQGPVVLQTRDAEVKPLEPRFAEIVLGVLTNPTIVFLLLIIGVQALLIEISSPGGWVAGFIGIVSLAMAGYGLGVLPVNWFGIIFLVLAFVLFILDLKAPTHGALTAAGAGSLAVGAMVLFNSPSVPEFQRVPAPIIISVSLSSAAVFFTAMMIALRAQKTPVRMGTESLIGRVGITRSDLDPDGLVQLGGEGWTARLVRGEAPISAGERIEVVGVEGLRLSVRRSSSADKSQASETDQLSTAPKLKHPVNK